jgi:virginiamycin B lyase
MFVLAAPMFGLVFSSSVGSQPPQRAPVSLPDGPGRELVEKSCAQCHSLQLIADSGYTREGWHRTFSTMVALPKPEADLVADYLAANFPQKNRVPALIVPGPVKVTIKEWDVPSLGSRPHDPLGAADGSLWWTGQWANVLGRLDPRTGAMKEFPLKTPKSGPHGLVEDANGNIWYTGNSAAHIGKLDPKTGQVTEYPMPNPAARDPHTPIFDGNGTLWFTVQQGNFVGRLIPATGEVRLAPAPTPRSRPYGIVINSQGVPWYVAFGTNKLGKVDPATLEITEYALPNAESRPRRLTITSDDVVWYADYSRGYLGRFDPKTGKAAEYPSPGGPRSLPYGMAAVKDIVWYSEAGVTPNTLVRFDPQAEKFQTWAIPSGGGVVRHMVARPDGTLVLACSGVNQIALVEVGGANPSR